MRFDFVEGRDGAVDVVVGADRPLLARALADASAAGPSTALPSRLSVFWIDTALALLRRYQLTGRDGPIATGASWALELIGDSVVASDPTDDARRESMPAARFEDLLVQWRGRIRAVRPADRPAEVVEPRGVEVRDPQVLGAANVDEP